MLSDALVANEQRLWSEIKAHYPLCTGVRVSRPNLRAERIVDIIPGEGGRGLLTKWMPGKLQAKVIFIGSFPVQDGYMELVLGHQGEPSRKVMLTLLTRSSWSGDAITLREACTWPSGVVLAKDEQETALRVEADFFGVLVDGGERGRFIYKLRVDDYSWDKANAFLERLRMLQPSWMLSSSARASFDGVVKVTRALVSDFILYSHDNNPARALRRAEHRLFKQHWVVHILNRDSPITAP